MWTSLVCLRRFLGGRIWKIITHLVVHVWSDRKSCEKNRKRERDVQSLLTLSPPHSSESLHEVALTIWQQVWWSLLAPTWLLKLMWTNVVHAAHGLLLVNLTISYFTRHSTGCPCEPSSPIYKSAYCQQGEWQSEKKNCRWEWDPYILCFFRSDLWGFA